LIFSHDQINELPAEARLKAYGLDFGYSNDPTALVGIYEHQGRLILDELLYKTGMTNSDIANYIASLGLDRRDIIWADSGEPKSIEEIHRMGWNIRPATKGKDSIDVGIDIMRRFKLQITSRSINLIKEFRNYKYIEDKNGKVTNKPIDAFNHGIDAVRYACFMSFSKPNVGKYSIR
jgi:phage terminase large subunit